MKYTYTRGTKAINWDTQSGMDISPYVTSTTAYYASDYDYTPPTLSDKALRLDKKEDIRIDGHEVELTRREIIELIDLLEENNIDLENVNFENVVEYITVVKL